MQEMQQIADKVISVLQLVMLDYECRANVSAYFTQFPFTYYRK